MRGLEQIPMSESANVFGMTEDEFEEFQQLDLEDQLEIALDRAFPERSNDSIEVTDE